jgi:hypothetical protein
MGVSPMDFVFFHGRDARATMISPPNQHEPKTLLGKNEMGMSGAGSRLAQLRRQWFSCGSAALRAVRRPRIKMAPEIFPGF